MPKVLLGLAIAGASIAGLTVRRADPDPSHAMRLALSDLKYAGAFRLPADEIAGASFSFGGAPLAFNPANNSLFAGTRGGTIAEVSIPEPVASKDVTELPFARIVQPFRDPTEGHIRDIASEGAAISGLLVHHGRLYGTGSIYYDAQNTQEVSHYSRALDLNATGVRGMYRVWEPGKAGFVAGYMAAVPPEWQSALGGPAVTGQCCVPIVFRTSLGPALFSWNPADLESRTSAAATPLVYYPLNHATLGPWEGSNPTYGATVQMAGVALVGATRTALFIGRNGLGPFCYGNGTADEARARDKHAGGEEFCYDPVNSDKSQHAYPYTYQFWAYDLNDLAAVRAGQKQPWDVQPYGVWPFELPIDEAGKRLGGVAFDADRRRLYISQLNADRDGYAYRPLIHVYQLP